MKRQPKKSQIPPTPDLPRDMTMSEEFPNDTVVFVRTCRGKVEAGTAVVKLSGKGRENVLHLTREQAQSLLFFLSLALKSLR